MTVSWPGRSLIFVVLFLALCSCSRDEVPAPASEYPVPIDIEMVGEYPALSKSGGGYFYDEVLEYRVWIDHDSGDYHHAFSTYEDAKRFSTLTDNAEEPLVLVVQYEHVNEPEPGVYEHVKVNRITEWQVEWLAGSKRNPNSIDDFLREKSSPHTEGQQD